MKAGLHLTVACDWCGVDYRQWRSNQRFCSRRCGLQSWHARNPERATAYRRKSRPLFVAQEARCKRCARPFMPLHSRHVYCSTDCKRRSGAGKGWSQGKEYVPRSNCELCGGRFYAPPVLRRRGGGRFCSNACRTRYMATHPERFPQARTRRGHGGRRPDLGNRYFRSIWEANYARYLNWLMSRGEIRDWNFEQETFEFPVKRGSKFYTPDFRVVENDGRVVFHEVKGYMDQRSATKLRRMRLYHPEVQVLLIDKDVYYDIRAKLGAMIAGWESAA